MHTQPRRSIRRLAAVGLTAALTLSLSVVMPGASAATAKLNGTCPKAGATATSGRQSLLCTKVGKKNVWKAAAPATTVAPVTTAATTAPPATSAPTTTKAAVAVAAPPADMNAGGILTAAWGVDLPGGTAFDPIRSITNADEPWMIPIYGSLMRATKDGNYDEWFAKSVDIVDPKTIKVTLNSGIAFSDGAVYDATAVQAGMMRNFNTPVAAAKAGQNSLFKELDKITVDGPLDLTFSLKTPVAGEFLAVFAGRESAVPSPKAIAAGTDLNKTPIGAGPYTFADYKQGQIISLRKSNSFFQASRWRLGGIDFVHAPTATVGISGLLAGTAQLTQVNTADVAKLESANRYTIESNYTDFSYVLLTLCAAKPPLDNLKVRQAMQIALNRDQINNFYSRGRGKPGYGFWPDDNLNFNPSLKATVAFNVAKAKQLMKDAGVGTVTVDLAYPSQIDYRSLSELLQSQLDPVGIKLNITPLANILGDFITPQKPGMALLPGSRTGVDKLNRVFQAGAAQVMCGQPRPEISSLTEQIAGMKPGDPKAVDLWQKIDQINAENAWAIFLVYQPTIMGFNRNEVGGALAFTPNKGYLWQNSESLYVKNFK